MNASPLTSAPANENAEPVRLELLVMDPEVAQELVQHTAGRERDAFARSTSAEACRPPTATKTSRRHRRNTSLVYGRARRDSSIHGFAS